MDTIAYIVTNSFIYVAVNKNLESKFGTISVKMDNTKKIHVINNHLIMAYIGDLVANSRVFTHLQKELPPVATYDEILKHLSTLFVFSRQQLNENKEKIVQAMRKLSIIKGTSKGNINELLDFLKGQDELIAMVKDWSRIEAAKFHLPNKIYIFGRENNQCFVGHYFYIGKNSNGVKNYIDGDNVVMYFDSAAKTIEETEELTKQKQNLLLKKLQLTHGWRKSKIKTLELKNTAKKIMTDELVKMSSPETQISDIIFYELSAETNFKLVEPNIQLSGPIAFNLTPPESAKLTQ